MKSPDRTINTVMGVSPTPYSSLAEMANGRGSASSVGGWASAGMIIHLIKACAHLQAMFKQCSNKPSNYCTGGLLDPAVSSFRRSEEHTSELQSLRHLVC